MTVTSIRFNPGGFDHVAITPFSGSMVITHADGHSTALRSTQEQACHLAESEGLKQLDNLHWYRPIASLDALPPKPAKGQRTTPYCGAVHVLGGMVACDRFRHHPAEHHESHANPNALVTWRRRLHTRCVCWLGRQCWAGMVVMGNMQTGGYLFAVGRTEP
jgi:hypothetical protein